MLRYAILDGSVSYTGRVTIYVGGQASGGFETLQGALAYAEKAYHGIGDKWQIYRPLSVEELAYIQELTAFVWRETPDGPYPEPPSVA